MRRFRQSPGGVLVATDVAARGLDVPDTHYVLNAEMPNAIEVCPPPHSPVRPGWGGGRAV